MGILITARELNAIYRAANMAAMIPAAPMGPERLAAPTEVIPEAVGLTTVLLVVAVGVGVPVAVVAIVVVELPFVPQTMVSGIFEPSTPLHIILAKSTVACWPEASQALQMQLVISWMNLPPVQMQGASNMLHPPIFWPPVV